MRKACSRAAAVWAAWVVAGSAVLAQNASSWPVDTGIFPTQPLEFARANGSYLSWIKIIVIWLVFLAGVKLADWVNQDAQRLKENYRRSNQLTCFSLLGGMVLVWVIPWFWLDLLLLAAAIAAPVGLYVRQRNAKVNPADQVLTREHIRYWASENLRPLGIKIEAEPRVAAGPPINLTAGGGKNDVENAGILLKAKQSPGFLWTAQLVADAVERRSQALMLDFSQQAVAVRYQIDGVWTDMPGKDRQSGDAILATMKSLAGLDPAQRTATQKGIFGANKDRVKYTCRLVSQGTKTGERAVVQLDDGANVQRKLPELGMSAELQAQLKSLLAEKRGFVVFAAPPGGGLTSLINASATLVDRFMRSVIAVEDVARPDTKIENVTVTTYDSSAGQTAATVLPEVIRQYPDAFVVPLLTDPQTVGILCGEVAEDRLVIAGIHAKEASEALLRVLLLKVPLKQFVPVVSGVVAQRLIRRLCDTCKQPYAPSPQIAQQLATTGENPETIYRPPPPTPADAPKGKDKPPPVCPDCKGSGYRGRVGIFELLKVDDSVRAALLKQPQQLDGVRLAARKAGLKLMQEEGKLLVAKGVTSWEELVRAMKEKD